MSLGTLLAVLHVANAKTADPTRVRPTVEAHTAVQSPEVTVEPGSAASTLHEAANEAVVATRTIPTSAHTSVTTAPTHTVDVTQRCCSGESDTACAIRRSVGAACGGEQAAPFDRVAAAKTLSSVNLSMCKGADGPTSAGHVQVTFEPTGAVSAVEVDSGATGTPTARCVAQSYRSVKVAPFSGSALTVGKTFTL